MTKEEFKKTRLEIDLLRTELFEEKCRLEDEYQKQIEQYIDSIGLKYGNNVLVTDCHGEVFNCVYNGVRLNHQGLFYLEFKYHVLTEQGYSMIEQWIPAVANINDELSFKVGDKVYDYNTVMGQFV